MTGQARLNLDPHRRSLRPAKGREAPVVWVRELRVLKSLDDHADSEVRRIKLRRGLNILWAHPQEKDEQAPPLADAVSGHGAGKTTFCRLLRYALGESTFGNRDAMTAIRAAFPTGWVLIEAEVQGTRWAVGRAFKKSSEAFAVKQASIDQAIGLSTRGPFEDFISALNSATTRGLASGSLPDTDEPVGWLQLLTWLSRDQEARFNRVLDWRHSDSESEAWTGNVDNRSALVEAFLDLRNSAQNAEKSRHSQLKLKHDAAKEMRATRFVEERFVVAQAAHILGQSPESISTSIFIHQYSARVADELSALDGIEPSSDELDGLTKAVSQANADVSARKQDCERLEDAIEIKEGELDKLSEKRAATAQEDAVSRLRRDPGIYCNVLLSIARAEGCSIAPRLLISATNIAKPRPANDAPTPESVVAELKAQLNAARPALARAQDDLKRANEQLHRWQAAREATVRENEQKKGEIRARQAILTSVSATAERLQQIHAEVDALESAQTKAAARIGKFREQQKSALATINEVYNLVVRCVFDRQSSGSVKYDTDQHIRPAIEKRGECSSAAIDTLKLLAFDYAALTASIEGKGHFPRFLIHDGPREADMDEVLYDRLFAYMHWLEGETTGEPAFQYIITTTTPPPAAVAQAPWLIDPVLDASRAESRLLGVDL